MSTLLHWFEATYLAKRYSDISKEVLTLFDALSNMLRSHDPGLIAEWMQQYRAPKPKVNSGEPVVDPFISKFQRRKVLHSVLDSFNLKYLSSEGHSGKPCG
jgi:hypothetical protein